MTPWLTIDGSDAVVRVPGALFNLHQGQPPMGPNQTLVCQYRSVVGSGGVRLWVTLSTLPASLCRILADANAREVGR